MNIAIVAPSPVPFQLGGAERLFRGLQNSIISHTSHNAELIKQPCLDRQFWPLIRGYKSFAELDLSHFDMVISTKYPAWAVRHPNHHLYLQHTCRGIYDLYQQEKFPQGYNLADAQFKSLKRFLETKPDPSLLHPMLDSLLKLEKQDSPQGTWTFPGPLTRAVIHWLDRATLHPKMIQSYNAISANVAQRQDYFPPGAEVSVIHHPSDLKGFFSKPGEYIFTASRLYHTKRVHLLLKAFARVETRTNLFIAGTGKEEEKLIDLSKNDPRVRFLGHVPDKELLEHYARALFVPFVPYDEDYGLITVEAMASGKPLLTTTDSGGVLELVRHGENGLVAEPEPDSMARAMQELISKPEKTRQMGENARESVSGITWKNTIQALLGQKKPWTTVSVPGKIQPDQEKLSQAGPQKARQTNPEPDPGTSSKKQAMQQDKADSGKVTDMQTKIKDLQKLQKQLSDQKRGLLDLEKRLQLLLQEAGKRIPAPLDSGQPQEFAAQEKHQWDAMYVAFEDRFRGSREDIRERQRVYLPDIQKVYRPDVEHPLLDLGCGRGEWLQLLRENGYQALGVDLNRVMVQECHDLGLQVQEMDALSFLRQCSSGSVSAVTGFHIIEHLPQDQIVYLLDEALRVLCPGGLLLFETPNPENILVGACYFYTDLSHKKPIVPATLAFLAEYRGFRNIKIKRLHKYSEKRPVPDADPFKEKWFYGAMDYALLGYK